MICVNIAMAQHCCQFFGKKMHIPTTAFIHCCQFIGKKCISLRQRLYIAVNSLGKKMHIHTTAFIPCSRKLLTAFMPCSRKIINSV